MNAGMRNPFGFVSVLLSGVAIGLGTAALRARRQVPVLSIHDQKVPVHQSLTGQVDVVFLGDSLTHWGEWAETLPDLRLANRGVAGDTVVQVRARLAAVFQLRPDTVVLTVGTNDIWEGAEPLTIMGQYRPLADAIRSSGAQLIAVGVPRAGRLLPSAALFNSKAQELNALVSHYCTENGVKFCTIDPDGPVDHLRAADGVHLNGEAYLAWSRTLAPWL